MTSENHKSGTDRCAEAYSKIGNGEGVIINIQGDEPFILPEQITSIMECFSDDSIQIATLVKPFAESDGIDALLNPNSQKVGITTQETIGIDTPDDMQKTLKFMNEINNK